MATQSVQIARSKASSAKPTDYRKIADDLAKDPKIKEFISLMMKRASDKKIREALGVSQDEALKLSMELRQKLNVAPNQTLRDRVKEIYTDDASQKQNSPKTDSNQQIVVPKPVFSYVEAPAKASEIKKLEKEIIKTEQVAEKLFKTDKDTYRDNYGIYQSTRIELAMDPASFRGVRDANGVLQAIASVKTQDDALKIEYLASSPWNIKPGDKRYTRGSGSTAIEQIVLESVRKGKDGRIRLEALPGAIPFYEKIGFKNLGKADGYNDGVVKMELSPTEARAFLAKRGVTDFAESIDDYNRALEELEIEARGAFSGRLADGVNLEESSYMTKTVDFAEIEIEILPKGTHTSSNGFKLPVSDRDLDDLVNSYDPKNFQAPLIISHDTKGLSDKEIGNSEFSFGIPKALRRVGDKVKAVFDKVAPEFEQWVRDRKLVAVSPSFYLPNSPSNPTPGKLSLRHIAALGRTAPAIKGMKSLQEAFNFSESDEGVVNFSFALDPDTLEFSDAWIVSNMMQRLRDWLIEEYDLETADRIIPGYEVGILMERRGFDPVLQRLEKLEEKVFGHCNDDYPNYQAMPEQELDFQERERRIAEREAALFKKEFASFCECELKGKLTPAIASQEELISFMSFLNAQEEVNFSEHKTESPLKWFKGFLTRLPSQVEFKEVAQGSLAATPAAPTRTADFNAEEVEADRQIRAYMQQHNVDYAEAMTALGILY